MGPPLSCTTFFSRPSPHLADTGYISSYFSNIRPISISMALVSAESLIVSSPTSMTDTGPKNTNELPVSNFTRSKGKIPNSLVESAAY